MALQFHYFLSLRGRNSNKFGSSKACHQHGYSQSAKMAGIPTRLAYNGFATLIQTKSMTVGSKWLLVLDNHGSHTTPEFRTSCDDNKTILLSMPPHHSHLLQLLVVGCFGPLKIAFSKQNQDLTRIHVFHVTKDNSQPPSTKHFWPPLHRPKSQQALEALAYIYLIQAVLSQLDPVLDSHSLPSSQGLWCTKTPNNTQEMDKQTTLIRRRLEKHQRISLTPVYEPLDRIAKGAQITAA